MPPSNRADPRRDPQSPPPYRERTVEDRQFHDREYSPEWPPDRRPSGPGYPQAPDDRPRYVDPRDRSDQRVPGESADRYDERYEPRARDSGQYEGGYGETGHRPPGGPDRGYDDRERPGPGPRDDRYAEGRGRDNGRYREPDYRESDYRESEYRGGRSDQRYRDADRVEDRRDYRDPAPRRDGHRDDRYPDDGYRDDRYPGDGYRDDYRRADRRSSNGRGGDYPGDYYREPDHSPSGPTQHLSPGATPRGVQHTRPYEDGLSGYQPDGVLPGGEYPYPGPPPAGLGAAAGPGLTTAAPGEAPGAAGAATAGPAAAPKVTVTRAVAHRGKQAAQTVTRKVVAASQADGARESGLTPLIWNQVLSFGADAMITVALAGTVFFGAAQGAQKTNVLGYLLITMAPFAIVAPIIGPALDRLQHGRRWAMAGTSFGRAILAVLMAQNFNDLLVLFPLALGSLVLSKAYSVVRAAAAPRVVPADMTLVSANARLSLFGLGSAIIGGGFIAVVIKVTHSYSLGLWLTAIAFAATGYFALRLPRQVDSANASSRHPEEPPRPPSMQKVPSTGRIVDWVSRGFDPHVIVAMQGASALRWGQGFLTIFLAFYISHTSTGFDAAAALGGIGIGVGAGNFLGTAAGARLKLARPEILVVICVVAATVGAILAAVTFSLTTSIACMAINSAANSLGKLSLDSVIQQDVSETLRSSAFARSETFLQLAWVLGATVALLLPSDKGRLGLTVAAVILGVTTAIVLLRARTVGRSTQPNQSPAPGTV